MRKKIKQLSCYAVLSLIDETPDRILIHGGCNDISSKNYSPENIENDCKHCKHCLQSTVKTLKNLLRITDSMSIGLEKFDCITLIEISSKIFLTLIQQYMKFRNLGINRNKLVADLINISNKF